MGGRLWFRRMVMNTIVRLADTTHGGNWSLISVEEDTYQSRVMFELERPYEYVVKSDVQFEQTGRIKKVRITVEVVDD